MKEYSKGIEIKQIPESLSDAEVIYWVQSGQIGWRHMSFLKDYTALNDETLSDWLNISVKTIRNYRKPECTLNDNIKEHLVLLLSLYRHGNKVFGSSSDFYAWLSEKNFFFDGQPPETILNTIAGIRFVADRLTSIEYGDNV